MHSNCASAFKRILQKKMLNVDTKNLKKNCEIFFFITIPLSFTNSCQHFFTSKNERKIMLWYSFSDSVLLFHKSNKFFEKLCWALLTVKTFSLSKKLKTNTYCWASVTTVNTFSLYLMTEANNIIECQIQARIFQHRI